MIRAFNASALGISQSLERTICVPQLTKHVVDLEGGRPGSLSKNSFSQKKKKRTAWQRPKQLAIRREGFLRYASRHKVVMMMMIIRY